MDKFIEVKRKAFDKDRCKHIIDFFEKSESKREDYERGYSVVGAYFDDPQTFYIKETLRERIYEYIQKHDFLQRLYAPWDLSLDFNIQKYLPGDAYGGEHMEHGKDSHDSRRLLGWMIYLNDCDGGTCWPQQNFTTKPRTGDLYIWPASWTHSHHGLPATKDKYIVTGWCEFNP